MRERLLAMPCLCEEPAVPATDLTESPAGSDFMLSISLAAMASRDWVSKGSDN